jgi:hypothetical protein
MYTRSSTAGIKTSKGWIMIKSINERLAEIQIQLKAPKAQRNDFGKYNYRNCEDILEAVKPLLNGLTLTLSDKMVEVGGRVYVEATAKLTDGVESIEITASAREALAKKGMDEAQITGAASSYARKYALNGMFCIDDTKDADSMNNTANNVTSFVIDEAAQTWINAVKSDVNVLSQLDNNPEYKEFIKTNAGI